MLLGEHRRTGRIRLGSFWLKRLLRLYPALLALVAVGLLLWNWVGDYKGASFGPGEAAFIALTYTGNLFRSFWDTTQGVFAHTWSLSMEEQFYLVWPPVLVLLFLVRSRRRWLLAGLGAVIVGCSVAAGLVYRTPNSGATPDVYFSPCSASSLATGCLLALLLDDERIRTWAAGLAGHVATWAGLALLVGTMLWIGDDWAQHAWTFSVVLPLTGSSPPCSSPDSSRCAAALGRVRVDTGVVVRPPGLVRRVPLAPPRHRAARPVRGRDPGGRSGSSAPRSSWRSVPPTPSRCRSRRPSVASARRGAWSPPTARPATPPRPDATGPVGGSPIRSPTGHRTGGAWRGPPRASRPSAAGLVRLLGQTP